MSGSYGGRKDSKGSLNSTNSQNIPKGYEDFLIANRLTEWPAPLTSEGPLDIGENNLGFGELEDIHARLADAAPVDYTVFDDLAERLDGIESLLNKYADAILVRPEGEKPVMSESMEQTFLTETGESQRQQLVKSRPKQRQSVTDIKKKSVDFYRFPGFVKHELTELPSQLEAPQILNEVTNAQDFNTGFRKFWQKVFLSEASVAVMQDLFWYYFIDKFDHEKRTDKNLLFDRIADSFVALFFSINPEIKDKFFQVYADCLAQAVYVAFYNGFPESTKKFDEKFIDDLVNICVEWVSGIKPMPESWRKWDIRKLVQPARRNKKEEIKAPSAASAFHGGLNFSLDIDGFQKVVNQLGTDRSRSIASNTKAGSARSPANSKLSFNNDNMGMVNTNGKLSHQIGPGPKFETVSFDTLGQSALVAHFLKQRKLRGESRPQLMVKRTQIAKLPPKAQTYQELIDERTVKAEILSRKYQETVLENEEEILKIQRKNAKMNKEINSIARQVMFNKNPIDIKIMSERVLDMRERQLAPTVTVNDTDDDDGDQVNVAGGEGSKSQCKLKIKVTE